MPHPLKACMRRAWKALAVSQRPSRACMHACWPVPFAEEREGPPRLPSATICGFGRSQPHPAPCTLLRTAHAHHELPSDHHDRHEAGGYERIKPRRQDSLLLPPSRPRRVKPSLPEGRQAGKGEPTEAGLLRPRRHCRKHARVAQPRCVGVGWLPRVAPVLGPSHAPACLPACQP